MLKPPITEQCHLLVMHVFGLALFLILLKSNVLNIVLIFSPEIHEVVSILKMRRT